MKKAVILFFMMLFFSCSAYFDSNDRIQGGIVMQPLALSGGGCLSSDDHDEITPFIYRDGGRAWIFFASDREGNFDIYYAEMFPDGKFSAPVKMGTNINTSGPETYPVVLKYNSSPCIGFVRYFAGYYWFYFYQLNGDFSYYQQLGSMMSSQSNLGLLKGSVPYLISASSGNLMLYSMPAFSSGNNPILPSGVESANGYISSTINYFVFEQSNRICYGSLDDSILNFGNLNPDVIPDYEPGDASVHDISPFVDTGDSLKVYFASDRYGKGNYDLYRYNVKTFNTILVPPQNVNVTYSSAEIVTWDAVPGAEYYKVYFSVDDITYSEIGRTSSTTFTCPTAQFPGPTSGYFKVKSFRGSRESDYSIACNYAT